MRKYIVQGVGEPTALTIEASSAHGAVALAAGCNWEDVCIPIWRAGPLYTGRYLRECYMPRDNSGRQWIVTMPNGEGVI